MTPEGAATAFAFLELDVKKAMRVFGKSERTVYYWIDPKGNGPPDHIALALSEMMAGRLRPENAKTFVKHCRSRRDADRYSKRKRT